MARQVNAKQKNATVQVNGVTKQDALKYRNALQCNMTFRKNG